MPVKMQYTAIDDGLCLSRIGLGCMGMSEFYGRSDDNQSMNTLRSARDHGINFFDTADVYGSGHNESLLAKTFGSGVGQVIVASKFGVLRDDRGRFTGLDGRPEYIRQACDASLKRLNRECIDIYYAHRLDPAVPVEETVGAMADLVSAGKIRYLGLCEVSSTELQRAHEVHPITVLQSEYSLWHRDVEQTILPVCGELGVAFVAFSPLGRGFLTGDIHCLESLEENDWRRSDPRLQGPAIQKNLAYVETISGIAGDKGVTAAQVALAWLLHQEGTVIPIPGTRHPDRLVENIGALAIRLTPDELSKLQNQLPGTAVTANQQGGK